MSKDLKAKSSPLIAQQIQNFKKDLDGKYKKFNCPTFTYHKEILYSSYDLLIPNANCAILFPSDFSERVKFSNNGVVSDLTPQKLEDITQILEEKLLKDQKLEAEIQIKKENLEKILEKRLQNCPPVQFSQDLEDGRVNYNVKLLNGKVDINSSNNFYIEEQVFRNALMERAIQKLNQENNEVPSSKPQNPSQEKLAQNSPKLSRL